MFTLTATHLNQLCAANEFPIDRSAMVFLGLRGCLPVNPGDHEFRAQQDLVAANTDNVHPRCTLVQWLPSRRKFAVYPGSTVPHRKYVDASAAQGGAGANQLLTGFFVDFRKGVHRSGKPTGHQAFCQTNNRPYRRTANDAIYATDDRVEMENPGDNLHAGWCTGVDAEDFASAGCQVLVGFPACSQRAGQLSVGPWRAFHDAAYALAQQSFGYALLGGLEAQRVALAGNGKMERVRFGSEGARARRVQEGLKRAGHYEGEVEGKFGLRSLRALLAFQEATFGPRGDDGICGPQTAEALDVAWP